LATEAVLREEERRHNFPERGQRDGRIGGGGGKKIQMENKAKKGWATLEKRRKSPKKISDAEGGPTYLNRWTRAEPGAHKRGEPSSGKLKGREGLRAD